MEKEIPPTIGRIVGYQLTADQANQVNRRRVTTESIALRMASNDPGVEPGDPGCSERQSHIEWPIGAQAHIGHPVSAGQEFPMIIVAVTDISEWAGSDFSTAVNGQVFLDGNDVLWVHGILKGDRPGCWKWPYIAK